MFVLHSCQQPKIQIPEKKKETLDAQLWEQFNEILSASILSCFPSKLLFSNQNALKLETLHVLWFSVKGQHLRKQLRNS